MKIIESIFITCVILTILRALVFVIPNGSQSSKKTVSRKHSAAKKALVSVLVPAFNEESTVEPSVRAILGSDYCDIEVIVIDDGSSDSTAEMIAKISDEDSRVIVVQHNKNLGKSAALNHGIAIAHGDVIVIVDADTIPSREFIGQVVEPLFDEETDAVAGNVRVAQGRGVIKSLQRIEYVSVLNEVRSLQGHYGTITTIAGAAGAVRREALTVIGGYSGRIKAEDSDATLRLMRHGYRVAYIRNAIVHTEVPSTWRELLHQRMRWSYGNIQCICQHWERRICLPTRVTGMPLFIYENLIKPPLELLRAIIPVLVLLRWLPTELLYAYLMTLGVTSMQVAVSFYYEREKVPRFATIVMYYAIWPFFAFSAYSLALSKLISGGSVPWRHFAPERSRSPRV